MVKTLIKNDNPVKHLLIQEYIERTENGCKPDKKYVMQMYKDFGIRSRRGDDDSGAYYGNGLVILPRTTNKDFFIAAGLHELGHAILKTKFQFNNWKRDAKFSPGFLSNEWLNVYGLVKETDEPAFYVHLTYPLVINYPEKYHIFPQYVSYWNYITQRTERYARLFEAFFNFNAGLKKSAPNLYDKLLKLLQERFKEDESIYLKKAAEETKRIEYLATLPDSPYNLSD